MIGWLNRCHEVHRLFEIQDGCQRGMYTTKYANDDSIQCLHTAWARGWRSVLFQIQMYILFPDNLRLKSRSTSSLTIIRWNLCHWWSLSFVSCVHPIQTDFHKASKLKFQAAGQNCLSPFTAPYLFPLCLLFPRCSSCLSSFQHCVESHHGIKFQKYTGISGMGKSV
jgi:hypothetical protein